ncbi:reverse transcriptase domain-containing protein [Tanacetum coccineum]
MGTPTQVCVWSCPNFSAPAGRPFSHSPLPEDPYEAIRQVYLDGTDTEFEPFEDPIDTETPESPLAIAPPIPLSESTPPVLVPILRRTARMVVRIPHAMSSGLSASMAEVEAMSESAFRKKFRSSYESLPSVSPPDLPSRKHYRGTSELVEDSEEDDDEEDEEIEESMDYDNVSKDTEDEGPTTEDKDPATEDEGLTARVEGPSMDDEGYGLDDEIRGIDDKGHSVESDILGLEEEEEAVHGGQQQAAPVVRTTMSAPLGLGYGALRRSELALEEGDVYSTRAHVDDANGMIVTMPGENRDLRLQLAEERSGRLDCVDAYFFLFSVDGYEDEVGAQKSIKVTGAFNGDLESGLDLKQVGGHHNQVEFAVRGKEPKCEVQIYTWMDATLRELTDLVKEVALEVRRRDALLSFVVVYPTKTGHFIVRELIPYLYPLQFLDLIIEFFLRQSSL